MTAHVVLLWHMHQPCYRDLGATEAAGAFLMPWVRLHAVRDYLGMALRVRAVEGARAVFNLTPCLISQLDAYGDGVTDRALELTKTPAEALDRAAREEILGSFFDADWHHQIFVHRRYRELFDARQAGRAFDDQDLRDLQMWFNLAWCCHELRSGEVSLPGGLRASVARYVEQERGFSEDDIAGMLGEQDKVLRSIVPLYRDLAAEGRVELTTTPYYHPILPILLEPDRAVVDRDGASVPAGLSFGDDAEVHVARAIAGHRRWFGTSPVGVWPAEGAVSPAVIPLLARHGVRWIATDQGVLARSGRWGYDVSSPSVRHRAYRAEHDGAALAVFFRDTELSDAVGFRLHQRAPQVAAAELVDALVDRARALPTEGDRVILVALDGENAWGGYQDDGRPFLEELYRRLVATPVLELTTCAGFLEGHGREDLPRVYDLATASWIDEAGSRPGVDLGTWIGETDENEAWSQVAAARSVLTHLGALDGAAYESLLAAEGSDWFWWLGTDQDSGHDEDFDAIFRRHVARAYQLAGARVPAELGAQPTSVVTWTFSRKVASIASEQRLRVRTHCAGSLEWRVDDGEVRRAALHPTGGVMAGPHRFETTLGPFQDRQLVRFRFLCSHEACPCGGRCLADEQVVAIRDQRDHGVTTDVTQAAPGP